MSETSSTNELKKADTSVQVEILARCAAHIGTRSARPAASAAIARFLTSSRCSGYGKISVPFRFKSSIVGYEAEMQALRDCYASLTHRERQVMALVASGLLNKQVGGELGISEITVKAHRHQVMRKMNADSLPDLVIMAARLRLPGTPKS